MLKINLTGVVVEDIGYGLKVSGVGFLEEIISRALGARDKDGGTAGYSEDKGAPLKSFKSNNCDISVTITPHPQEAFIENDEYNLMDIQEFLDEQEAKYEQYHKKNETSKDEE